MKNKIINITAEVKKLLNDGGKAKAIVSVNFDGVFVVRGVRLVDGAKGLFLSMPSRKTAEGEYKDICFPINNDFRIRILDAAKTAYEKALTVQDAAESGMGMTDDDDAA